MEDGLVNTIGQQAHAHMIKKIREGTPAHI